MSVEPRLRVNSKTYMVMSVEPRLRANSEMQMVMSIEPRLRAYSEMHMVISVKPRLRSKSGPQSESNTFYAPLQRRARHTVLPLSVHPIFFKV